MCRPLLESRRRRFLRCCCLRRRPSAFSRPLVTSAPRLVVRNQRLTPHRSRLRRCAPPPRLRPGAGRGARS
eukprot:9180666-Pyramimonas_sp.AAC.1